MMNGFFAKLIKFCVVGGSGVLIDFGITYLCKELLKINKYISNSIGFICAASSNYMLNRVWTFESHDPDVARQYAVFIGISLVGLAINNLIVWLLNDHMKVRFRAFAGTLGARNGEKVDFYASKLCAIVVVTVWNFLMNYFFNF